MTTAMTLLNGRYEMTPQWTASPRPVRAQIGGVARAGRSVSGRLRRKVTGLVTRRQLLVAGLGQQRQHTDAGRRHHEQHRPMPSGTQ